MNLTKRAIAVFIVVLVILSSFSLTAFAESESKATPSGFDYSEIESTIEGFVNEHNDTTKSLSVAVYNESGVIYKNHFLIKYFEKHRTFSQCPVFFFAQNSKLSVIPTSLELSLFT